MKPLRLGLKYCGGCSPRFDRVAWVSELEKMVADRIVLLPYDDPEAEAVIVVAGCESACVDIAPFAAKPVFMVSDPSQMDRIIDQLTNR